MKHFFIISGGNIKDSFACQVMGDEQPDYMIAADSGMDFLYRNHILPDMIIGDFDSVSAEALSYFKEQPQISFRELDPVKDDTDTEFAIRLAIEMGAGKITVLGATGSRLDHVLGNIELLGIGLKEGVPIIILDMYNRVRMIEDNITMVRQEQFGSYVSLIPYTQEVTHVWLKGFKYPLSNHCLRGFCSIGVSNEIVEEEASIEFQEGILIVIESRD